MSDTEQKDYTGEVAQYPMFGVTSFAELDEVRGVYMAAEAVEELADHFCMLASNIVMDETITDKTAALKALAKEFAARVNAAVNKTKESRGLLAAVRRLLKRQPEQPVEAEKTSVDEESEEVVEITGTGKFLTEQVLRSAANLEEVADRIDPNKSFTLWKTKEGGYRWLAVYSNQFRDSDNPPEILSEKAHKAFVAMVDAGLVDYPELWHWHIPGTTWGKADWVAYDSGFALASGYIYPGHEKEAELVSRMGDIRVSHGMPSRRIVRNKEDASIIDMYVSVEISDLPGYAAANKLTDFVMLKEFDEMLSQEKRDYLSKAGLDEATISQIEQQLDEKAKAAKGAGLESKEQAAETAVTEQTTDYATRQEVADVFAGALKPLTDTLNALQSALTGLQAEVKALKQSDEDKVAAKAAATPRASLQDLVAQSLIGNPAAQIDGRSSLAKAGPKQADDTTQKYTGIPILDGLIRQQVGAQ